MHSAEYINGLVEAAIRGYREEGRINNECFDRILCLLEPRTVSMLCHGYGIRNRADQGELCQEVAMRFYQYEHSYDLNQPFLCWFYALVRNVARTFLNHNSQRKCLEHSSESAAIVADRRAAQNSFTVQGRKENLAAALRLLDQEDHQVVWLFYYEGFTVKEIATHLDKSLPMTKYLLRRARHNLEQALTCQAKSSAGVGKETVRIIDENAELQIRGNGELSDAL